MRKPISTIPFILLLFIFICPLHTKAYDCKHYFQLKLPAAPKPPADAEKVKQGILKKLSSALQFRKAAREKEKQRILQTVNDLSLNDSIKVSSANLKLLIEDLSEKQDKHYDSLLIKIDSLRSKIALLKPGDTTPSPGPKEEAALPVPDNNSITDSDIDDLVNKILPLVSGKAAEEKDDEEKRKALSIIKKVSDGETISSSKREGRNIKEFKLVLHQEAVIFGFYNARLPYDYRATPFKLFNWWVYDALLLNGKTGNFKSLNGWDTAAVVDTARKEGCKIAFTLLMDNKRSTSPFLRNVKAQQQLADNIIYLAGQKRTDGMNICFRNLESADKTYFTYFISFLSKAVKTAYPHFMLGVTIPGVGPQQAYDIIDLDKTTDLFFIEDAASLSFYLNQKIAASKFVLNIPVSDTTIDHTASISRQYGLVKNNKLGGTGICYVSNTPYYNSLWNELLYKLVTIDSVQVKDSIIITATPLTFFQKWKRKLALYQYIVNNPCKECFEEYQDDTLRPFLQHVYELRIDSTVKALNKKTIKSVMDLPMRKKLLLTEFDYISNELTRLLFYVTFFFALVSIVAGAIYIYYLKNAGDGWAYKKVVARLLVASLILFTLSLFSYVLYNDSVPFFGVSQKAKEDHEYLRTDTTGMVFKAKACIPDPECVNIPLPTLLGIIILGGGIGILLTYLALPLLKQEDVP
jgi:hypothetical protein